MPELTLFEPEVFRLFVKPGEVVEVRAMEVYGRHELWAGKKAWANGIVSGYYDEHTAFVRDVQALDQLDHGGVYFTAQVIDPRLIGRSFNRLCVPQKTTSDTNVIAYRYLLLDIDPTRPSGVASSDAELQAALNHRDEVAEVVQKKYSLSAPIRAMSGNGAHLLYRLPDYPAKAYAKAVEAMLKEISAAFSTPTLKIDETVFNPSRIWKLYGTTAKKGDSVPAGPHREARPHRLAFIDHTPAGLC